VRITVVGQSSIAISAASANSNRAGCQNDNHVGATGFPDPFQGPFVKPSSQITLSRQAYTYKCKFTDTRVGDLSASGIESREVVY
jgi:hypothetical protein